MAKDEFEEETYSLILGSIKHPLRRRILRMLSEKPLSFSEILAELAIDSGHLNYHIKNIGEIVTKNEDGKYSLSKIGQAAVKLMSGVEEQHLSTRKTKTCEEIKQDCNHLLNYFCHRFYHLDCLRFCLHNSRTSNSF